MGAAEEIFESFFANISKDDLFKDSFIKELKKLVEAGTIDRTTLRALIEDAYPNADKD
jgi:hypothetical protein